MVVGKLKAVLKVSALCAGLVMLNTSCASDSNKSSEVKDEVTTGSGTEAAQPAAEVAPAPETMPEPAADKAAEGHQKGKKAKGKKAAGKAKK